MRSPTTWGYPVKSPILIFELQTFNLPPYRWPIRFLSSSHPPGTHVWIYQWFDQFSGFSCFRSNNSKCFGFRAHWHSKLTHISWFWIQIGPFFDLWQPKNHRKPSKMRGLELPVNKALPTEISFWGFLYTIRHTKWRDLVNKNHIKNLARIDRNGFTNDLTNFRQFWPTFLYVQGFLLARSLHLVYKKSQNEISVGSALFTGNSRPLILDGFWAVTDWKMAQSGSKIMKFNLFLNVNGLPAQKIGNHCS
jgi:hypothetical protein